MAELQVVLTGNVTNQMTDALIQTLSERVSKGVRSILLAISSPGGFIHPGVTAFNFLMGLGIEVITHNIGQVDSIAGPIYCAGSRRLATPSARFLIHGVTWSFGQNAELSERQLLETVTDLQGQRETIARILAERTGKGIADVEKDMFDGRVYTATEAMDYGFVHEIREDVFDPSQEIVRIP